MHILKAYIREVVKRHLNEQTRTPKLPQIPAAAGGGAVPEGDSARLNAARVQFARAAINLLNGYNAQLNQLLPNYIAYGANPANQANPNMINAATNTVNTLRNLNSVANQVNDTLANDTNDWKTIPENLPQMDDLRPEDSPLRSLLDATNWTSSSPNPAPPTYFSQNANNITTELVPQIVAALQAYVAHYQG
jgi:hypothetical protein